MANTSLKLIAAQEKHIKLLQEKLDKLKREQMLRFTSTPGWPLFILKHTPSYVRRGYAAKTFMSWADQCDISFYIVNDQVNITCTLRSDSFTSGGIPLDKFDDFIKDSIYEPLKNDTTSWYWSSYRNDNANACKHYGIPDINNFLNGRSGTYENYYVTDDDSEEDE